MTSENFKIARLAMGMTQNTLAKRLGVSRSNIIRYEKDSTGISRTIEILLFRIFAAKNRATLLRKKRATTS